MRGKNPYIAGDPVGNTPAYVGREDVLSTVLDVLGNYKTSGIVLYGQRRIGKTSIQQELTARLPEMGAYRTVYFDLMYKASRPLGEVLIDLAKKIAVSVEKSHPGSSTSPENEFRVQWLPSYLDALPKGVSLVLLFDEFDVLDVPGEDQAANVFFPYIRELMSNFMPRLKFVFAVGRSISDLSSLVLSLFKAIPSRRVSLLSKENTFELVRLSEANQTLRWPDEVVNRVWNLTNGHPFLTQQLCSTVWFQMHKKRPGGILNVTIDDVDVAIPEALEKGMNALVWIWDGLPPAQQIVASALAEAGGPITREKLENLLIDSGIRVIIRELQDAAKRLQDWDLIEPVKNKRFRFRVEMLRQWVTEYKPLYRVREVLDEINPTANVYFSAATEFYRTDKIDEAVEQLKSSLGANPNHAGAALLLAEIYLSQENPGDARDILEKLYETQPGEAGPRLVQALLELVKKTGDEDEKLAIYDRVLEINKKEEEALKGRRNIWELRGESFLKEGRLENALDAFKKGGLIKKCRVVDENIRQRELDKHLQALKDFEAKGNYGDALDLLYGLKIEVASEKVLKVEKNRLKKKIINKADPILEELRVENSSLEGAALLHKSGILLSSIPGDTKEEEQLAAMTVEMYEIMRELRENRNIFSFKQVRIEGENGAILIMKTAGNFLLTVVFEGKAHLGNILQEVEQAAEKISCILGIEKGGFNNETGKK